MAAPPSYAVLKPGASDDEIVALEETFGVSVPEELKALWRLSAGESGVDGSDLMLGGWALMPLDAVIEVYQMQMRFQEENGADDTPRTRWCCDSSPRINPGGFSCRWLCHVGKDQPGPECDVPGAHAVGVVDVLA
ncbi:SMI1/KNR4 family protein [Streptomyces sp. NBC_01446]|uniref:SMI1/KNR4 family protein n=1 Tax=Streptomyces sp. NBC_01446 TaxID=2903870 RepID=UPI00224CDC99|nr:SMI1/KNR4 family protein [Streptomyces sp. NBC_01446]MCX4649283.1 SMI1/KNR4 family protein [Streptomyces sp. NBC_01446]